MLRQVSFYRCPVRSRAIHCPLLTCDKSYYYEPTLKFKVDKALEAASTVAPTEKAYIGPGEIVIDENLIWKKQK